MSHSFPRVVEEVAVGLYILVLCVSIAGYGWTQVSSGSAIGGAFIVIGLFWLTVITAVAASLVVIDVNSYAHFRETGPDWKAMTFASLTPLAYGLALYLAFTTPYFPLWVFVGGLGLLGSLGLIVTVFEGRAKRVWTRHVH